MEVISAAPFLIICALSALLQYGFSNLVGKIDMIAQILLLFACIICVALAFLTSTSKRKNRIARKKTNEQRDELVAQCVMYFAVSILSVFDTPKVFLPSVFVCWMLRLVILVKAFKRKSIGQKIYRLLMNLTWFATIACYGAFLVIDELSKNR